MSARFRIRWVVNAVLAGALIAWAFLLTPQFLGGPVAYVMVSGTSMEPTLASGELVIVRRRDSYRVGDVVAYRVPAGDPGAGSLVIHRIVGGSATGGFVARGDNRTGSDLWRPKPDQIVGRLWLSVPGVGSTLRLLQLPLPLAGLAALFAFLLLAWPPPRPRSG